MSSRSEQYIARAENCQQYADAVQSLGEKILYQELATQWLRLAEQADKTDEAGTPAVESVVASDAEEAAR